MTDRALSGIRILDLTTKILGEVLGLSAGEVAELRQRGVVA